ncbi:MAG: hypothetical protein HFI88_10070 [Lachnospiraceae bacterium]|nr:hypothetical protein [Lachnospiraceae bacterium]
MVIKDAFDWTSTVVRAADLIKIADQIRNDQKKYVNIAIRGGFDENTEGNVYLSAASELDFSDKKKYSEIPAFTMAYDPDVM